MSDPRTVCSPWITAADLCCNGEIAIENCADPENPIDPDYLWTDEELCLAASNILFARTCFKYPGLCTISVWPCGNNCRCSRHPCACGTFSKLELPTDMPIVTIDEVRLDGVAMDPSDYRLDRGKWLVRMDGLRWPSCNSFDLPNSTAVEIVVDATVGREPPMELKIAASDLACEMKKACNGSDNCSLPPHVRNIARRGIEIELDDITSLFKDGQFGINSVDMAVRFHECKHHGQMFDPLTPFRGYGFPRIVEEG